MQRVTASRWTRTEILNDGDDIFLFSVLLNLLSGLAGAVKVQVVECFGMRRAKGTKKKQSFMQILLCNKKSNSQRDAHQQH